MDSRGGVNMIIDIPAVTDDTPPTAVTENFLRKVLEYRDANPWPDAFSQRNWEGFAFGPNNPLTNTIVVRDTAIANDIYFVTGSINYMWVYGPTTHYIKDGFMACCRLDKLNDLTAWHINLSRGIQDIFNSDPGIGVLDAQIPTCNVALDGGNYGMTVASGNGINTIINHTNPTNGVTGATEGVFCHTVGGVGIAPVAGTIIAGALPTANQVSYPLHHMWYAMPLDGVVDGTVLTNQLISTELRLSLGAGIFTITNYAVWGDLCVIGVASKIQSGKSASAVAHRGAQLIPMCFNTNCWDVSSSNYGAYTRSSWMDAHSATGLPAAGGGAVAFLYDISVCGATNPLCTNIPSLANSRLGQYITVGAGYAYESAILTQVPIKPLIEVGTLDLDPDFFGASRNYSTLTTSSPIITQDQSTAPELESSDLLDGAYYTEVQELSQDQGVTEPILFRLQVPQFETSGKPWEGFSHITYHYTNVNILNADLGVMPVIDITSKQIGPIISSNTQTHTWQTFPTTEERGFQVTNLSNTLPIQGCKFSRPDSQNLQNSNPPPAAAGSGFSKTCNNIPTYSADIRGFAGSYSPTNDIAADFETVRPYILCYDTLLLSTTIIPNYAAIAIGDPWLLTVTGGCFFDVGPTLVTYLQNPGDTLPAASALYQSGGIMNMAYHVGRNQWVISFSANRVIGNTNSPAYFIASSSNLQRFSYFKPLGSLAPVLAQYDAITVPAGIPQTTSYMFANCAGGSDLFTAYTLGGNFATSADGVGGTAGTPGEPGQEGALQLTEMAGASGRSVIMWIDYVLYDGIDSLIATIVQELGLNVTIENVEWYKKKMIHGDVLNMTYEEVEAWVKSQQAEYHQSILDAERQGRQRQRKRQQKKIAGDMIEDIDSHMNVDKMDFIEADFIARNLKQMSDFPDQDDALKHQIITDEQWTELDSLYGTPVPKKETTGDRKRKAQKSPESDADDE